MSRRLFASLMTEFLLKMGLPAPDNLQHDTCTVSFEQRPDIHYVNHIEEYIDVIAHIGILPDAVPAEVVTRLLALNNFERNEPMVALTIHPMTKALSLLSREKIHQSNVTSLMQITGAIQHKSEMVSAALAEPA